MKDVEWVKRINRAGEEIIKTRVPVHVAFNRAYGDSSNIVDACFSPMEVSPTASEMKIAYKVTFRRHIYRLATYEDAMRCAAIVTGCDSVLKDAVAIEQIKVSQSEALDSIEVVEDYW